MRAGISNFYLAIFSCMISLLIMGCHPSTSIYRSSTSKKDYLVINAVTVSHCGCSNLYADNYTNGKLNFQIIYNDNLARKTIFEYTKGSKIPQKYSLLATTDENFTTPFDSLDLKIFNVIDSAVIKKQGTIYPIRWTKYKGYVADTLQNRN